MFPSTNTVNGWLLCDENEAILIVKFLILFDEMKRPEEEREMMT